MKKYLSIILTMILLFSFSSVSFAEDMNDQGYIEETDYYEIQNDENEIIREDEACENFNEQEVVVENEETNTSKEDMGKDESEELSMDSCLEKIEAQVESEGTIDEVITETGETGSTSDYYGSYYYSVLSDGTCALTGYSPTYTLASIPQYLNGYAVSRIDKFKDQGKVLSVTLPNTVKSISSNAFSGCSSIIRVYITDNSVTSVGDYAFYNCSNLKSISESTNLKYIGEGAFCDCSQLESFSGGELLTYIGKSAFSKCKKLSSVTIPNGVKSIEEEAFYLCSLLDSITLPSGLQTLGKAAFFGCKNLKSISIPNGIENLSDSTFYNCVNLAEVTLPSVLKTIGAGTFYNCSSLVDINIPISVTEIGGAAFENCSSLKQISIPDGVTQIASRTFRECTKLEAIEIPDSVTTIGAYSFYRCIYLRKVSLPEGLLGIGDYAFVSALSSATIPNSVKYIGTKAIGTYYDSSYGTISNKRYFTINCGLHSEAYEYAVINEITYDLLLPCVLHEWEEVVESVDASCTDSGMQKRKCIGCDECDIEVIPAKGHEITIINSVAPTYTKKGLTAGERCSVCGIILTEQEIVPMKTLSKPSVTLSNTSSGVKIGWKKITGATGYKVYKGSTLIKSISSGSTISFVDTSAKTNGCKYTYKVYATAGTNKSVPSIAKTYYYLSRSTISGLANNTSHAVTVTYSKNTKASGYQIQYSASSKFSSSKVATVSSYGMVTRLIGNLAKGKTYYFKVRSYKTVNNIKYYSAWSNVKYIKITK